MVFSSAFSFRPSKSLGNSKATSAEKQRQGAIKLDRNVMNEVRMIKKFVNYCSNLSVIHCDFVADNHRCFDKPCSAPTAGSAFRHFYPQWWWSWICSAYRVHIYCHILTTDPRRKPYSPPLKREIFDIIKKKGWTSFAKMNEIFLNYFSGISSSLFICLREGKKVVISLPCMSRIRS